MAEGLILVTSWPGQPSVAQLEREAREGLRPRTDYVELARQLAADVVDADYMSDRSSAAARAAARLGGLAQGQVVEALVRGPRQSWVVAWADHLGFRLAAAAKVLRRRMNLTVVSVRLATPKKRLLLGPLSLHTHIRAIVNYGSAQRDRAIALGVPTQKLRVLHQPVDERFWQPMKETEPDLICAVGSEARDYQTLLTAVEGLPLRLEIAVGSSVNAGEGRRSSGIDSVENPEVSIHRQLGHRELRDLYARARLVVVPLRDVDYDAGVTAITEALAMAKPVIVTGTRGQIDVIRDGVEGVLIPPADARAMRVALERLMGDPRACDRMGAAGRRLVCEHHSLDRYIASLREIVAQGEGSSAQEGETK